LDRLIQNLLQHLREEHYVGPYKIQVVHGSRGLVVSGTAMTPFGKL